MHVWLNGSLVDPSDAVLPIDDHGLVVGDAVFTTMRAIGSKPVALSRHLTRLRLHLEAMSIAPPPSELLAEAVQETLASSGLADARIRLTVTAGSGSLGSGAPDGEPAVIVAVTPFVERTNAAAITVPWTRNERGALSGLKTTSYGENVRMLAAATAAGAGEALMTNTLGQLCEGTGSNVFVVIENEIVTPPLSSGCLAGIARSLVFDVATVTEEHLDSEVLTTADEVFLTSSLRHVQGLTQVDDRQIEVGPVTLRTAQAFADLIGSDSDPMPRT